MLTLVMSVHWSTKRLYFWALISLIHINFPIHLQSLPGVVQGATREAASSLGTGNQIVFNGTLITFHEVQNANMLSVVFEIELVGRCSGNAKPWLETVFEHLVGR